MIPLWWAVVVAVTGNYAWWRPSRRDCSRNSLSNFTWCTFSRNCKTRKLLASLARASPIERKGERLCTPKNYRAIIWLNNNNNNSHDSNYTLQNNQESGENRVLKSGPLIENRVSTSKHKHTKGNEFDTIKCDRTRMQTPRILLLPLWKQNSIVLECKSMLSFSVSRKQQQQQKLNVKMAQKSDVDKGRKKTVFFSNVFAVVFRICSSPRVSWTGKNK